jgi:uncharacterized protein (TIGR02594 family)
MSLPAQYQWLLQEDGPKMLKELLSLFGTTEVPGAGNNQVILGWAKELGLKEYNADSIPWCGLAMAHAAFAAGKPVPKNPLWALNWAQFGTKVKAPMLGDVLTFKRQGGGHVGMYVGEDSVAYHVLGGNQGDKLTIIRIGKDRLYQAVRPPYNNQPINVRVVKLAATGGLSQNEA